MTVSLVLDEPEFCECPTWFRIAMIWESPVRLSVKLRALWLGISPDDVMKEQCAIRFHQFGGEQMHTQVWEEHFLNEMPVDEFVNMILRTGS